MITREKSGGDKEIVALRGAFCISPEPLNRVSEPSGVSTTDLAATLQPAFAHPLTRALAHPPPQDHKAILRPAGEPSRQIERGIRI